MTKPELTGTRDLQFSGWIRKNLPDSRTENFIATDVDFFLYNWKTKNILILEVKTHNAELKYWQKEFYKNLDKWIKMGIDVDWTYHGVKILKFENTFFDDGKCFLDGVEITEEELIKILSLKGDQHDSRI
jgi:hypothetical protein